MLNKKVTNGSLKDVIILNNHYFAGKLVLMSNRPWEKAVCVPSTI